MTMGRSALRPIVGGLLGALVLQLLLGMWVNLWVVVPAAHPGAHAASYFGSLLPAIGWSLGSAATMLRLHVALGILLFLGGVLTLVLAIRGGQRAWIWTAAVGLTAIMGAAFNGLSFVNFGHNFSSYLMTVAFVIAAGTYAVGMWATRACTRS